MSIYAHMRTLLISLAKLIIQTNYNLVNFSNQSQFWWKILERVVVERDCRPKRATQPLWRGERVGCARNEGSIPSDGWQHYVRNALRSELHLWLIPTGIWNQSSVLSIYVGLRHKSWVYDTSLSYKVIPRYVLTPN